MAKKHGYWSDGKFIETATLEEATYKWREEQGYEPSGVFKMPGGDVDTRGYGPSSSPSVATPPVEQPITGVSKFWSDAAFQQVVQNSRENRSEKPDHIPGEISAAQQLRAATSGAGPSVVPPEPSGFKPFRGSSPMESERHPMDEVLSSINAVEGVPQADKDLYGQYRAQSYEYQNTLQKREGAQATRAEKQKKYDELVEQVNNNNVFKAGLSGDNLLAFLEYETKQMEELEKMGEELVQEYEVIGLDGQPVSIAPEEPRGLNAVWRALSDVVKPTLQNLESEPLLAYTFTLARQGLELGILSYDRATNVVQAIPAGFRAALLSVDFKPVTFAPPGKKGTKPNKLFKRIKKNMLSKKGVYFS